jgi:hypothetical protein
LVGLTAVAALAFRFALPAVVLAVDFALPAMVLALTNLLILIRVVCRGLGGQVKSLPIEKTPPERGLFMTFGKLTAGRALFARAGQVDVDGTTIKLFAVQLIDSGLSLFVGAHLNKAEALAATGVPVGDDLGRSHGTSGCEKLSQHVVVYAPRQGAYEKFICHYFSLVLWSNLANQLAALLKLNLTYVT